MSIARPPGISTGSTRNWGWRACWLEGIVHFADCLLDGAGRIRTGLSNLFMFPTKRVQRGKLLFSASLVLCPFPFLYTLVLFLFFLFRFSRAGTVKNGFAQPPEHSISIWEGMPQLRVYARLRRFKSTQRVGGRQSALQVRGYSISPAAGTKMGSVPDQRYRRPHAQANARVSLHANTARIAEEILWPPPGTFCRSLFVSGKNETSARKLPGSAQQVEGK